MGRKRKETIQNLNGENTVREKTVTENRDIRRMRYGRQCNIFCTNDKIN